MNSNIENQLSELFNKTTEKLIRISSILMFLDFSEFLNDNYDSKFTQTSIIRLYIFRLVKGLKNYERCIDYLNNHENEAFELGFFKDESNKLQLPPKRTFNHLLKTYFTDEQRNEFNLIAQKIISLSSSKNIVLDLEIVKKVINDEKPKLSEKDIRDVTKLAKKLLYPNLKLSIRNTGKYNPSNILDLLTYISSKNSFANDGSACFHSLYPDKLVPNGDTVLYHLNKFDSVSELLDIFEKISDNLFDYVRKNYNVLNNSRRLDIAFDIHDMDYWGEDNRFTVGGKKENGTTEFFKFLTASIVVAGIRFIIGATPILPGQNIPKLLDKMLRRIRNKIRIDTAYLDRGFNSIDFINVLNNNKARFLMPVDKWPTVESYMFKDPMNCKDALVYNDFVIGNKKRNVKVNLVIVKDKPGEFGEKHPFICNFPVAEPMAMRLYDMYGKRWGIESCYRLLDTNLRPRTTSNNYNIRLFYFLFSCHLYNLWVLINIAASLALYGRIRNKPIISVDRFMCFMIRVLIDYLGDGS